MIALHIEELKDFTTKLLVGSVFDDFLFLNGTILTDITVTMDGLLNKEYFDTDELTDEQGRTRTYASWRDCRELAFFRIRGKRLPLAFRFVLFLSPRQMDELFSKNSPSTRPEPGDQFFLNIQYKDQQLMCTSGVHFRQFRMDQSMNKLWDEALMQFFDKHHIEYQKMA